MSQIRAHDGEWTTSDGPLADDSVPWSNNCRIVLQSRYILVIPGKGCGNKGVGTETCDAKRPGLGPGQMT